jgi:hypothetical protein
MPASSAIRLSRRSDRPIIVAPRRSPGPRPEPAIPLGLAASPTAEVESSVLRTTDSLSEPQMPDRLCALMYSHVRQAKVLRYSKSLPYGAHRFTWRFVLIARGGISDAERGIPRHARQLARRARGLVLDLSAGLAARRRQEQSFALFGLHQKCAYCATQSGRAAPTILSLGQTSIDCSPHTPQKRSVACRISCFRTRPECRTSCPSSSRNRLIY